jgi:N-acetylglucosamine malate deacetylase 2
MPRSLLLVFAHPDDESFLTGGTVSKYAADGVRVVLVTATRGEAGKAGNPPLCAQASLGEVREQELRRAAAILGIAGLHVLGYPDRELHLAPPEQVREQLLRVIRAERPDVVVSFDPNGGNLHPDHVAISRFASDAVAAAADGRWHPDAGAAHGVGRLAWVPGRRPWQLAREADLRGRAGVDFVIDVADWREQKLAALRAHATQHQGVERGFLSQPDLDLLLSTEVFRLGAGRRLANPAADLFEGL